MRGRPDLPERLSRLLQSLVGGEVDVLGTGRQVVARLGLHGDQRQGVSDDVVNLPGDLVAQRCVVRSPALLLRRQAAGPKLAALRHESSQAPGDGGAAQLCEGGLRHVLGPEGERDDSQLIPVPVPRPQRRADDNGYGPHRREPPFAPPACRVQGHDDRQIRGQRRVGDAELECAQHKMDAEDGVGLLSAPPQHDDCQRGASRDAPGAVGALPCAHDREERENDGAHDSHAAGHDASVLLGHALTMAESFGR